MPVRCPTRRSRRSRPAAAPHGELLEHAADERRRDGAVEPRDARQRVLRVGDGLRRNGLRLAERGDDGDDVGEVLGEDRGVVRERDDAGRGEVVERALNSGGDGGQVDRVGERAERGEALEHGLSEGVPVARLSRSASRSFASASATSATRRGLAGPRGDDRDDVRELPRGDRGLVRDRRRGARSDRRASGRCSQ
jgi:hypothetical protein